MLGILPIIMNPGRTPVGLPIVSGRMLLLATGATIAVFVVARYRANRSAVATMRAFRFLAMAQQAAGLMLIGVEELAPLLGLGRVDVARWGVDGVPVRHHRAVADLHWATIALRQRFPAQVTRRLLAARFERKAASIDARRHMADLSQASRQGHISITLR